MRVAENKRYNRRQTNVVICVLKHYSQILKGPRRIFFFQLLISSGSVGCNPLTPLRAFKYYDSMLPKFCPTPSCINIVSTHWNPPSLPICLYNTFWYYISKLGGKVIYMAISPPLKQYGLSLIIKIWPPQLKFYRTIIREGGAEFGQAEV